MHLVSHIPTKICKVKTTPEVQNSRNLVFMQNGTEIYFQFQFSLPTAVRAAQSAGTLVTQRPILRFFCPAGATRYIDGHEIWHGGGNRPLWSSPLCQISPPSVQQ